jgi:hypothetical protein
MLTCIVLSHKSQFYKKSNKAKYTITNHIFYKENSFYTRKMHKSEATGLFSLWDSLSRNLRHAVAI